MIDDIKTFLSSEKIDFFENVMLKDYCTFKIGGPCPLIIFPRNAAELKKIVLMFHQQNKNFMVFGRGSNVLISDQGIAVPVIWTQSAQPDIQQIDHDLIVSSGTKIDALAVYAADHALEGVNFMSGIPGTIGGAIIGNAGAYGAQIGDRIVHVDVITDAGQLVILNAEELQFSYRHSMLKEKDYVILSARISLDPGDREQLMAQRQDFLIDRQQKHVDYHRVPCAGSFFKNIILSNGERRPIGQVLEQAGCKALSCGDAAVFEGHANIIINKGNASAKDVLELAQMMTNRIKAECDVNVEPEVRLIGAFN